MKYLLRIVLILLPVLALYSCGKSENDLCTEEIPTCIEDLSGKKVAVLTGSLQDVMMDSTEFSDDMLRLGTVSDLIASLNSRTSDFVLLDSTSVLGAGLPEKGIACVFKTNPSGYYGFAFRKDDYALCREFNHFFAGIKADGTFDAIKAKWIDGDPSIAEMPEYGEDDSNLEPLVIGTAPFYPFSFIRGEEWVGFEIDILSRYAHSIGRRLVMLNIDFGGVIAALVSGKVDVISASLTINEERAKTVLFSEGYYYAETGCFVRASDYGIELPSVKAEKKSLWQRISDSFYNNFIEDDRYKLLIDGAWETFVITIFSILLGTLFGAFLCLMKFSLIRPVRGLANGFCTLMGGLPILVILMIMFYVVFATSGISPRWVAIIAFSMSFGASVSSILFSGINSIDKGQREGGLALGFTSVRTFLNFILPQAVKNVFPLYKGEAVSLLKSTSVVGYIAIQDLTKVSDVIRARTFDAFFPLIVISIIYFILAWLLGLGLDALVKRR